MKYFEVQFELYKWILKLERYHFQRLFKSINQNISILPHGLTFFCYGDTVYYIVYSVYCTVYIVTVTIYYLINLNFSLNILIKNSDKRPLRTKVRYFQNPSSDKRPLRIRVRLPVKSI